MSNVEFETDFEKGPSRFAPQQLNNFGQQKYGGTITSWLVSKGVIKDESQARGVLIGIFVFNMVITAFVLYFFVL